MDRKFIIIAIVAFALEAVYLAFDLEWLHWSPGHTTNRDRSEKPLGEIESIHSEVRKRGFESAFWEDSSSRDRLFANDSVLTLKGSAAKLKLAGDVHLNLHENTLIVIEPLSNDKNGDFRLQFQRGDLRSHSSGKVALRTGEWIITASSGSDISLRTVDGDKLELEVQSGHAQLRNQKTAEVKAVASQERLAFSDEKIHDLVRASSDLSWADPRPQRIYTHHFPAAIPLQWQGEAERLEVLRPTQGFHQIVIASRQQHTRIDLGEGTHQLTLRYQNRISSSLTVEVLKAPPIVHLFPLPRNRVRAGESQLFAWMSGTGVARFEIQFSREAQFQNLVQSQSTSQPQVNLAVADVGEIFWRIVGFDEEQFLIPADYSYPLFVEPDPLAAPILRSPSADPKESNDFEPDDPPHTRKDDKSSMTGKNNSWWLCLQALPQVTQRVIQEVLQQVFQEVFIAEASAEPKSGSEATPKRSQAHVIFNWEPVPGADHYVIEISSHKDFRKPEVIAKASATFYSWQNYDKQIYYYRVAAGTADGRLGYFSNPQPIDLSVWPPKGVTVESRPVNSSAREIKKPSLPPSPPRPPVRDSRAPPTKPPLLTDSTRRVDSSLPRNTALQEVPLARGDREFRLWWQPLYALQTRSVHNSGQAQFSGFHWLSAGFSVFAPDHPARWGFSFGIHNEHWQPSPADQYSDQPKLNEWPLRLDFDWNSSETRRWRTSFGQAYKLSRRDLESVESQPVPWLGISGLWHPRDPIGVNLGLKFGVSLFAIEANLEWIKPFKINNLNGLQIHFENLWFNGRQDVQLVTSFIFGVHWKNQTHTTTTANSATNSTTTTSPAQN